MTRKLKLVTFACVLGLGFYAGGVFTQDNKPSKEVFPDTDSDGFIDILEEMSSLNPKVDECKYDQFSKKCKSIDMNGLLEREYFIYILDQSGSMNEKMDGKTRMDVAKEIVTKYIKNLPENFTSPYSENPMRLGLYTYGMKQGCEKMEEIQSPFKVLKRKELIEKVQELVPNGGTPIAQTLDEVAGVIKTKNGKFHVMLITDGVESCDGDPIESAKQLVALTEMSRSVKLSVVGLGIPKETEKELQKIALASNGSYHTVNSASEFEEILANPFREMINNLEGLVCLQSVTDQLIECENKRVSKLNSGMIKLENPFYAKLLYPQKQAVKKSHAEGLKKTNQRLEVYRTLKKEGSKKTKEKINDLSKIVTNIKDKLK
jgi:hypothetical protein